MLHGGDVGAIIEHVGGKRVAEHVRRTVCRLNSTIEGLMHHLIYIRIIHGLARRREKERVRRRIAPGITHAPVLINQAGEFRPKRYDALLTALAHNLEPAGAGIDVAITERHHL